MTVHKETRNFLSHQSPQSVTLPGTKQWEMRLQDELSNNLEYSIIIANLEC